MRRFVHRSHHGPVAEALETRCLLAAGMGGEVHQVGHFFTWDQQPTQIPSTDVAGLTYHPASNRLYLADSEINELSSPPFQDHNIFVTTLEGQYEGEQYPTQSQHLNTEPTGITYNVNDGFFYVSNDNGQSVTKYDANFAPITSVITTDAVPSAHDPEGITSDLDDHLYVVDGRDGGIQVLVYDTSAGGIDFVRSFSIAEHVQDGEGIAYDDVTGHLFVVSSPDKAIFEFTLDGEFVESYDIGGFRSFDSEGNFDPNGVQIDGPQGLTFGPTTRQDLYPGAMAVYIADGMMDNFADGQVFEAILNPNSQVPGVVNSQVTASSDDAEEHPSTGAVDLLAGDLDLGIRTVGLRFTDLNIPQGATITDAYLQFQVDNFADSQPPSEGTLTIHGEKSSNASTFTSDVGNITSRPLTNASVNWSPPLWDTLSEVGPDQQTPSLVSIIQEIVDDPSWEASNALALILGGTGKYEAESFDGTPSGAALLHVEYGQDPNSGPITYRVNAGGPELSGTPEWAVDTQSNPSPFHGPGGGVSNNGHAIDMSHSSIPAGTPEALFQTERYSSTSTPLSWDFPVTPGDYEVRLYFAEIWSGAHSEGVRTFDVAIEGAQVLNDYDVFATVGPWAGIVETFVVSSDSNLDIDLAPVTQKPSIKGIEILSLGGSGGSTNQPPIAMDNTVTTTEDNAYAFQVSDFTFSDAEGDALASVTISNLSLGGGTLQHSGSTAVNDGDTLTPAQLGTLVYTPPASTSGVPLATFDFIVNDADPGTVSAQMDIDVIAQPSAGTVYRVNAGGSELAGAPAWSVDTKANPSPFHNSGSDVFGNSHAIDLSHASIPGGTPEALFQIERWDAPSGNALSWDFPVAPGDYEVRLYFAEIWTGAQSVGARQFDVSIEGALVLDNYDIFATVGPWAGVVESFVVTSDGNLDIDFAHVAQNPAVKGIEIISLAESNELSTSSNALDFGTVEVGQSAEQIVQLTHTGAAGDPDIAIQSTSLSGLAAGEFSDSFIDAVPVTLAPGESYSLTVTYHPTVAEAAAAELTINHDGDNTPLTIALTGNGAPATGNQPPVASDNTVSTTEDSAYAFQVGDFPFTDAEGDALMSVTISNQNLDGGTLVHSGGTSVTDGDTLTPAELNTLVYTPAADAVGEPLATFDFTVNDANPGVVSAQMNIDVTGVNDPPVAHDNMVSTSQDNAYAFHVNDFTYSDLEGDALVSATITNLNLGGGTLQHSSGTTANDGDTLTAAQLSSLVYTPPAGTLGEPLATFDFTVNDADPGVVSATMDVNVTSTNNPPVAIDSTVSTSEDTAYSFQVGDFNYNDAEGDPLMSVTITNLNLDGGTLVHSGGTTVNDGDTLTDAQLASLVYTPAENASGTPLATFDFTVNDANPGVVSAQMDIDVTAVNDPPVAIANTVSTTQDNPFGFDVNDFTYSDAEGHALQSATITNLSLGGGTLQHSFGTTVNDGDTLTAIQLATLEYTPPTGTSGAPLATFDFTVNDADPGVVSAQMAIDVTPAPIAQVVYRVNAGGSELSGTPAWSVDSHTNPSPHHNTGTKVYSNSHAIDLSHSSIPEGTPEAVFQSERYSTGGNPLSWDFAVTPGDYEVRLYFSEIWTGTQAVGARTFDVAIEGAQVLNDYDVFATVGAWAGVMESFVVTSDGNLDIDFTQVVENPSVKGIEIIQLVS